MLWHNSIINFVLIAKKEDEINVLGSRKDAKVGVISGDNFEVPL